MATFQEVHAWASAGQNFCSQAWMLHDAHPDNPCTGFPMYFNQTAAGCGRLNTGDVPRMEDVNHSLPWSDTTDLFDCACAGLL
jgi:hypothetical protein